MCDVTKWHHIFSSSIEKYGTVTKLLFLDFISNSKGFVDDPVCLCCSLYLKGNTPGRICTDVKYYHGEDTVKGIYYIQ